jgi:ubiquinol-cytochrome c reductase cytochrome b subunit
MKPFRDLFAWFDDRLGLSSTIMPVVRHPVPRNVNWWYVFGSASLTVFILQVITGVGLALNYVAAPNDAYQSLQFITEHATLGHLLRGMHYFGASAMVVLVLIHMTRVFLTGSFKYPRELNWLTGLALLGLTLTMAFTGQVLRWDENGYWSTVIAAEQIGRTPAIGQGLMHLLIGGNVVSGVTLTRFFSTHVFLVPALVFGFIGVHIYLVIHKGISEYPEPGKPVDPATYKAYYQALLKDGIPFFPDAAWKDMVFALLVVCLIVALAIWVGPPTLANPANPAVIQTYPRPDWRSVPPALRRTSSSVSRSRSSSPWR